MAQCNQQFFESITALFTQLKQVFLAFQVFFQVFQFFLVDFSDIQLLVFRILKYLLLQQHLGVKIVAFLLQALIPVADKFIFFLNFGNSKFNVWFVTRHERRDYLLVDSEGLVKILVFIHQVLILSLYVLEQLKTFCMLRLLASDFVRVYIVI